MIARNISLGLISISLLTCAGFAQAGEVSMDVRNMAASTQSLSTDESRGGENTAASSEVAAENSPASRRPQWRSTMVNRGQTALSTDPETDMGASGSSAAGTTGNGSAAPSKPRNRWQSLVPGAIK